MSWVKEAKDRAEEARLAHDDLKAKLNKALAVLQTISIFAADNDAPASWKHESRVQWTAAKGLQEIAKMQQRPYPWKVL